MKQLTQQIHKDFKHDHRCRGWCFLLRGIDLLANQDEFDVNLILAPGVN